MIDYRFSLELTKGGIQKTILAKSGEREGRRALITLTESGKVFDVTDCSVRAYFDDETQSDYLTIVCGCVEFVFPSAITEVPGERRCELQVERNGCVVYSPVFCVFVEQSIGGTSVGSAKPIGNPIDYQQTIPNLPVGGAVAYSDEVAVNSNGTTKRVKIDNLPFSKPFENEDDLKKVSENNGSFAFGGEEYAKKKDVPQKLSSFENDKNFVSEDKVSEMIQEAVDNDVSAFSPTIDVDSINNGHRVTVTDFEGVEFFDVLNGKDGKSAYAYAIGGGYSKSEAEFYKSLANIGNNTGGAGESGGSAEMLPPKVITGQTIGVLLDNGDTHRTSTEVPEIASSEDSLLAQYMANINYPEELGGSVAFYAPPFSGELTYVDPISGETKTMSVNAGYVYKFSVNNETWELSIAQSFNFYLLDWLKPVLFTEQDKLGIVSSVLDALPTWNGGAY